MYRKILVPLDGSLRAETILPHVESLALRLGAEVVLLYVDAGADLMLERDEVADVDAFLDRRRQLIKKRHLYLQAIADKWHSAGIRTEVRIARGAVVAGIIDVARQTGADLVAMASHGEGGEQRTFYGSVAASLLNRIDRPLLLIRSRYLSSSAGG